MAAKARLRLDGADPINRGLVRFFPFTGATPNGLVDISPRRAASVFVGSPTTGHSPRLGRGITFDGSTNYANTAITDLNYAAGTVVWWQRATTAFNSGTIRGMWGHVSGSGEFSAQVFNNNNWYIGWRQGGDDRRLIVAASAANWPQNEVTCYAYTYGPNGGRLYVNGQLSASTATAPNPFAVGAAFAFGAQTPGTSSTYFNGTMWLPRFIARELTLTEIQRLYRDPWAGTQRAPLRGVGSVSGAYSLTLGNVSRLYGGGTLGLNVARNLTLGNVTRQYGAGAVGLTVARALTLGGVSRTYGAGDITLTRTRPMDLGSVARAYAAGDMTMIYDGRGSVGSAKRTRRGTRRVYLPEPEEVPIILPPSMGGPVVILDDDEEEEWFLLS